MLGCRVYMVVILKLCKWKESNPVVLPLVNEESKVLSQLLVNPLCLLQVETYLPMYLTSEATSSSWILVPGFSTSQDGQQFWSHDKVQRCGVDGQSQEYKFCLDGIRCHFMITILLT